MELKKQIIDYIFENKDNFQLTNDTINNFSRYVYDEKGDYLIGGDLIVKFIKKAIDLIINNK